MMFKFEDNQCLSLVIAAAAPHLDDHSARGQLSRDGEPDDHSARGDEPDDHSACGQLSREGEPDNNWTDDEQDELQVSNEPSKRIVPYSSSESQDDEADDGACSKQFKPVVDSCSSSENESIDLIPDSNSDTSQEVPIQHRLCLHLKTVGGGPCDDDDGGDDDDDDDSYEDDGNDGDDDDSDDNEINQKVTVAVTSNTGSQRKWDKKNVCKYCLKPQSKLSRHLLRKHADEIEVAQIAAMPLRSKRRRMCLRKLLNDGNYMHNVEVLSNNIGEIIPCKRPSSPSEYNQFIPCEYCKAMFLGNCLWKHKKMCPYKPDSQTDSAHHHHQARGSLLLPFSPDATEGLKRDILSVMHQDEVTAALRVDSLIMKFGSRLHFRHGHLPHRWPYIRERIRQMGRFLVKMRQSTTIKCLSDCLIPEYFDSVVKAVRSICGFDEQTHVYKTPSLALKIGHSLKECVRIEINVCAVIGSSADEKKQKFKQFLSLCDNEWGHEVSSHALRSLHQRKFNKPTVLPLAEDVKVLHSYLTAKASMCMESLSREPTVACWSDLCQITLAQVVAFNRRRGGEAERMLLSAYCSDSIENVNEDVSACLSRVEVALCKEFRIVHVEGKRGRKVPVLLTRAAQAQIASLIELRAVMGVCAANKFVFARRNALLPIRSSDSLRRFARECGAQNGTALTSTKLRKHVATMSQMLSLRKHELDILATFMGHDIHIHREFYRLPEETLQVAKVSKLLIAMERGELASLQGRNLDDVDVDVPGM